MISVKDGRFGQEKGLWLRPLNRTRQSSRSSPPKSLVGPWPRSAAQKSFSFSFHIRMILFAISHHDRQKLLEGTYYQLWYYPSSRKMWAKGDSQPPPFFCLRWKGIPMIQLVLIKTCLSKQRVAVLGVLTSPMDRSIKRQIADPLGFKCLRVPH